MAKRKKVFDTTNESVVIQSTFRKKFTQHDLCNMKPATENQKTFLDSCYNEEVILAAGLGSAGTGKTFLSLYAALDQVFDPCTPYTKVIVVRNAVEVRSQGFIKGSLEEKEAVYEAPYIGLSKELLPRFNDGYAHLKSLGYLEFLTTSFIRGITLNDCIIVVDECQNLNQHEMYSILTRVGYNCKIIVVGDGIQSDLKKEIGCFNYINDVADNIEGAQVVEFTTDDIVRSGFVKNVIEYTQSIP